MKKCLLILLCCAGIETKAQKIYIIGKVLDLDNHKAVPLASIKNIRTREGTKTTVRGDFYLPTHVADSVEISCIGYKTRRFYFGRSHKDTVLYLKQDAIQLAEVTIMGLKDKTLKKEIEELNSEPERSKKFTFNDAKGYAGVSGGSLNLSPISMLYDAFSKEGKQRRHLAYLVQQDRYKYYSSMRYNRIAAFTTKLSGKELDDFRSFCGLSQDFILSATDYDLTYDIIQCWKNYSKNK